MEQEPLEMILEDINGKFELILEGYQSLEERIERNHQESNEKHAHTAFLIETLNRKIDGVDDKLTARIDGVEARLTARIDEVAAELRAHRADTEGHQGYRVREE